MKIRITFDFPDEARRALAAYYGEKGLASSRRMRAWINGVVDATFQDIQQQYQDKQKDNR